MYKIITELMNAAGMPKRRYIFHDAIYPLAKKWKLSYEEQVNIDMMDIFYQGCFYRISSRYRNKIEDLDEYLDKTNHVWTHSDYCNRSGDVYRRFDKVVYIIRDPRDVALSTARFAFTPYMKRYYPTWHPDERTYLESELDSICSKWLRHVTGHLENRDGLYFIFYENLKNDLAGELQRLTDFFDLSIPPEKAEEIVHSVRFQNMRAKNPGHVKRGACYDWQSKLTDDQKIRSLAIAKPALEYLNYPLTDYDKPLPRLPKAVNEPLPASLARQM